MFVSNIDFSLTEDDIRDVLGEVSDDTVQGTHATGKTGKMAKIIPCQGKHREFGNFAKTQGIWFAQVVHSLILKIFRYLPRKFLFFRRIWIRQFCVCNSHKSRKLAQGKFTVRQGKHREFENSI